MASALETVLARLSELEKKLDSVQKTVDAIKNGLSEEFGDDLFETE